MTMLPMPGSGPGTDARTGEPARGTAGLLGRRRERPAGRMGWMRRAACREFPELPWTGDGPDVHRMYRQAMRGICRSCPVRAACEAYAVTEHVTGGFWAGRFYPPFDPPAGWRPSAPATPAAQPAAQPAGQPAGQSAAACERRDPQEAYEPATPRTGTGACA